MQRIPEPELMTDVEQARAYAEADFSEPHEHFAQLLVDRLTPMPNAGRALDLGCGDADVTLRVARRLAPLDGRSNWAIDGVDGSDAMLDQGRRRVRDAGVEDRVTLVKARLPKQPPPHPPYPLIFSNSLLHHLEDPAVLWSTILQTGAPGAAIFVMDLARPKDDRRAEALVDAHASDAPEILRRDFLNSLRAAYRVDEVREQIDRAGLAGLQIEVVSDRHWIAWRAAR